MTTDKLHITNEMLAFDRKERDFYDGLTTEEKKKFSPFLMIRWGSSVQGSPELESYYLISTNERLNRDFFEISTKEHKKLQWLLATTVSPGMGKQYHKWIALKKKESSDSKNAKFLREMYPHFNDNEINLMLSINTKDDLKQLAKKHGWDDKRIKAEL